tara:strand:- start:1113 stop:1265 length:153 start_codon:yes stop_codon:yes gene_type:complete
MEKSISDRSRYIRSADLATLVFIAAMDRLEHGRIFSMMGRQPDRGSGYYR